ncbi:MAG: NAD(P)-binding protein, partial [Saprospiraceae bacterium]|nr:NAD(P)-binding protein [Saprospiraceae bacterium]
HYQGTGALREQIPVYQDFLPPCNQGCPAGENIQAWLALVQAGKMEEAWRVLTRDNPMPSIHGRVCYHPCEDACNRKQVDSTVSIHAVERFLGDMAIEKGWQHQVEAQPSGNKVLIVGAGPSGLSAAYHLCRRGHEVHVYEAGPVAGGMMHFGIPAYRLPRDILEREIDLIAKMGVQFHYNHKVEDLLQEKEKGGFDAVFVAVGAHISKKVDIPQREAGKILDAISFLKEVEKGERPKLGRRVAIYGGGNTAMDAARTAKRLGYEPLIIYRRDMEHMPAHTFEAEEAMAEGVKINWLRTIKEIDHTSFKVEEMEIDETGRPQPTGRFETLEADALILALGQDTDTSFLKSLPGLDIKRDGTVAVGSNMMTGHPGVFAGGDMIPDERSVTIATGHGKKAAKYIDAYLRNFEIRNIPKNPVVGYEKLHLWFKTEAPRKLETELKVEERIGDFTEIKAGLTQREATYEAARCLSCGNCFECDACYGSCPEDAIIKLGPGNRYKFNYDLCTGCAVCFEQCPCHAIEMVPEAEGQIYLNK